MHEMQTIVTNDCSVCPSSGVGSPNSVGTKGAPKWAQKGKMVKSLKLGRRLSDLAEFCRMAHGASQDIFTKFGVCGKLGPAMCGMVRVCPPRISKMADGGHLVLVKLP